MTQKRSPHSYKCKDSTYDDAMLRASKENTTLTNVIETFVENYAKGVSSTSNKKQSLKNKK
jgi:hypothetical protein